MPAKHPFQLTASRYEVCRVEANSYAHGTRTSPFGGPRAFSRTTGPLHSASAGQASGWTALERDGGTWLYKPVSGWFLSEEPRRPGRTISPRADIFWTSCWLFSQLRLHPDFPAVLAAPPAVRPTSSTTFRRTRKRRRPRPADYKSAPAGCADLRLAEIAYKKRFSARSKRLRSTADGRELVRAWYAQHALTRNGEPSSHSQGGLESGGPDNNQARAPCGDHLIAGCSLVLSQWKIRPRPRSRSKTAARERSCPHEMATAMRSVQRPLATNSRAAVASVSSCPTDPRRRRDGSQSSPRRPGVPEHEAPRL